MFYVYDVYSYMYMVSTRVVLKLHVRLSFHASTGCDVRRESFSKAPRKSGAGIFQQSGAGIDRNSGRVSVRKLVPCFLREFNECTSVSVSMLPQFAMSDEAV